MSSCLHEDVESQASAPLVEVVYYNNFFFEVTGISRLRCNDTVIDNMRWRLAGVPH